MACVIVHVLKGVGIELALHQSSWVVVAQWGFDLKADVTQLDPGSPLGQYNYN
jgi:hypothetical protein